MAATLPVDEVSDDEESVASSLPSLRSDDIEEEDGCDLLTADDANVPLSATSVPVTASGPSSLDQDQTIEDARPADMPDLVSASGSDDDSDFDMAETLRERSIPRAQPAYPKVPDSTAPRTSHTQRSPQLPPRPQQRKKTKPQPKPQRRTDYEYKVTSKEATWAGDEFKKAQDEERKQRRRELGLEEEDAAAATVQCIGMCRLAAPSVGVAREGVHKWLDGNKPLQCKEPSAAITGVEVWYEYRCSEGCKFVYHKSCYRQVTEMIQMEQPKEWKNKKKSDISCVISGCGGIVSYLCHCEGFKDDPNKLGTKVPIINKVVGGSSQSVTEGVAHKVKDKRKGKAKADAKPVPVVESKVGGGGGAKAAMEASFFNTSSQQETQDKAGTDQEQQQLQQQQATEAVADTDVRSGAPEPRLPDVDFSKLKAYNKDQEEEEFMGTTLGKKKAQKGKGKKSVQKLHLDEFAPSVVGPAASLFPPAPPPEDYIYTSTGLRVLKTREAHQTTIDAADFPSLERAREDAAVKSLPGHRALMKSDARDPIHGGLQRLKAAADQVHVTEFILLENVDFEALKREQGDNYLAAIWDYLNSMEPEGLQDIRCFEEQKAVAVKLNNCKQAYTVFLHSANKSIANHTPLKMQTSCLVSFPTDDLEQQWLWEEAAATTSSFAAAANLKDAVAAAFDCQNTGSRPHSSHSFLSDAQLSENGIFYIHNTQDNSRSPSRQASHYAADSHRGQNGTTTEFINSVPEGLGDETYQPANPVLRRMYTSFAATQLLLTTSDVLQRYLEMTQFYMPRDDMDHPDKITSSCPTLMMLYNQDTDTIHGLWAVDHARTREVRATSPACRDGFVFHHLLYLPPIDRPDFERIVEVEHLPQRMDQPQTRALLRCFFAHIPAEISTAQHSTAAQDTEADWEAAPELPEHEATVSAPTPEEPWSTRPRSVAPEAASPEPSVAASGSLTTALSSPRHANVSPPVPTHSQHPSAHHLTQHSSTASFASLPSAPEASQPMPNASEHSLISSFTEASLALEAPQAEHVELAVDGDDRSECESEWRAVSRGSEVRMDTQAGAEEGQPNSDLMSVLPFFCPVEVQQEEHAVQREAWQVTDSVGLPPSPPPPLAPVPPSTSAPPLAFPPAGAFAPLPSFVTHSGTSSRPFTPVFTHDTAAATTMPPPQVLSQLPPGALSSHEPTTSFPAASRPPLQSPQHYTPPLLPVQQQPTARWGATQQQTTPAVARPRYNPLRAYKPLTTSSSQSASAAATHQQAQAQAQASSSAPPVAAPPLNHQQAAAATASESVRHPVLRHQAPPGPAPAPPAPAPAQRRVTQDAFICRWCGERKASWLLQPCNHLGPCETCCPESDLSRFPQCLSCNQTVHTMIRIYSS